MTANLYARELVKETEGTDIEDIARRYAEQLEEAGKAHPSEIASLYPEIIIQRRAVLDGLKFMLAAQKINDVQNWRAAHEVMTRGMEKVEKLCLNAAKVNQLNNTTASLQIAQAIMKLAVDLVFQIFGRYRASCDQFERELNECIEIVDNNAVTKINRHRLRTIEVQDMDELTLGATTARVSNPALKGIDEDG